MPIMGVYDLMHMEVDEQCFPPRMLCPDLKKWLHVRLRDSLCLIGGLYVIEE